MSVAAPQSVFGPMPSLNEVWVGVQETLDTWLATYLRERERRGGRPYASLPKLRGYRVLSQSVEAFPGDQLPLCVIVTPGFRDLEATTGSYRGGTLEATVSIVVAARNAPETLGLAADYGAALRCCLEQHRTLSGACSFLHVLNERYDEVGPDDDRTLAVASCDVWLRFDALVEGNAGPAVPDPDPPPDTDPGSPTWPTVLTTHLTIERMS